ncbi:hypothetical protein B6U98_05810 [Thermoplasmatales archaeon ex4572_165]|nr:MAG: hypothetical protein B6U98_05810 [Thermoplasmatales archaeon ex4572_165]
MYPLIRISDNKRIIALWLLRCFLLISFFIEISNQRWPILYMNILVIGVSFLPSFLKRIFSISLPFRFEILFLSFLVFSVLIEKVLTGILIELILGMFYGVVGFIIMYIIYMNSKIKINYSLIMLFSFSFSVAIGAIWEVFRFLLIFFLKFNFGEMNEYATAIGLILTITGASIISIVIFIYTRFLKGKFFLNLADDVARANPNLFSISENRVLDIEHIISNGENENVEFKSTLRTNVHTGNIDKKMEFAVLKAIVAFFNTNGGTLIIGVRDNGSIEGIEIDGFDNQDMYYRHFTNLFKKHIGKEYMPYLKTKIIEIKGKHILLVECAVSQHNVFLNYEGEELFFIRSGPTSIILNGRDLISYITKRF